MNCPWCGTPIQEGDACRHCGDLDGIQQSLLDDLCTRTDDCPATADKHEDDCPVEAELKAIYGF